MCNPIKLGMSDLTWSFNVFDLPDRKIIETFGLGKTAALVNSPGSEKFGSLLPARNTTTFFVCFFKGNYWSRELQSCEERHKGSSWLNYVQIIGLVCKTSSPPQFLLPSAVHSNVLGYVRIRMLDGNTERKTPQCSGVKKLKYFFLHTSVPQTITVIVPRKVVCFFF